MADKEMELQEEQMSREQRTLEKLKEIKQNVREDDSMPVGAVTLRRILGGDFLSAELVRRNLLFTVVYVAFRYQCQQDMIQIDKMESDLKDAKYRALSSSSTLTERCRESQVLRVLRENNDTLLHISTQPPYIINIPEQGIFSREENE